METKNQSKTLVFRQAFPDIRAGPMGLKLKLKSKLKSEHGNMLCH